MSDTKIENTLQELDAVQQMDDAQDTFESVKRALEALDEAFAIQDTNDASKAPEMALHLNAACEALGLGLEAERSGFQTVIDKVVATIMRVVEAMIDYFKDSNIKANDYVRVCGNILANIGELPSDNYVDESVKNQAIVAALSFEGNSPRFLARELEGLFADTIRARKYSPIVSLRTMVATAATGGDVAAAFGQYHNDLETGLKDLGETLSVSSKELFSTLDPALAVYTTKRLIGDRFVFGQITPATNNQHFVYTCQVRRDPQAKMRVDSLPALRVPDITLIARVIRTFCENMVRNSNYERDLYAVQRDVRALMRSNPSRKDMTALRTIVASAQSVYLVKARYSMSVCQSALFYIRDSLRHHINHSKKNGGKQ